MRKNYFLNFRFITHTFKGLGNQSKNATVSGGTEQRRPKLSEKMKSLSLDCPPTATTEDQNIEASSEYGKKIIRICGSEPQSGCQIIRIGIEITDDTG